MFREHLQTPAKLIDWLAEKCLDETVGRSGDPCKCPVANFLIETGVVPDNESVSVGLSNIGLRKNPDAISLDSPELTPGWVKDFIIHVDALEKRNVTAEACFNILEDLFPNTLYSMS